MSLAKVDASPRISIKWLKITLLQYIHQLQMCPNVSFHTTFFLAKHHPGYLNLASLRSDLMVFENVVFTFFIQNPKHDFIRCLVATHVFSNTEFRHDSLLLTCKQSILDRLSQRCQKSAVWQFVISKFDNFTRYETTFSSLLSG